MLLIGLCVLVWRGAAAEDVVRPAMATASSQQQARAQALLQTNALVGAARQAVEQARREETSLRAKLRLNHPPLRTAFVAREHATAEWARARDGADAAARMRAFVALEAAQAECQRIEDTHPRLIAAAAVLVEKQRTLKEIEERILGNDEIWLNLHLREAWAD